MSIFINKIKYKIKKKLGEGGSGKIYLVLNELDKKEYAIKEFSIQNEDEETIKKIKNEAFILSSFNSKNIVKYHGSQQNKEKFYILMEYCNGSNLKDFIKEHSQNNTYIEKKIIYYIIKQICSGIKEIHDKNIIHRDLKPENIFMNKEKEIKIGDFGISHQLKSYKEFTLTDKKAGTLDYIAPEILYDGLYNKKADMWSLGCIIYELFTLDIYSKNKFLDEIKKVDTNVYNPKWQQLIDSLLQIDYNKRFDINQVNEFILFNENRIILSSKIIEINEAINYEENIEKYFEDYKVYDLFEKLFKELIINRPDDPINYLISRLKRKDTKRIFITGYSGTNCKKISKEIANALGYHCIIMADLINQEISKKLGSDKMLQKNFKENKFVDNEIVLELLRNQLIKLEEENNSYIIESFPNNSIQAIFLQSIGLFPDNIIILTTSEEKAKNEIYKKLRKRFPSFPDKNYKTDEQLNQMAKFSFEEKFINILTVKDLFNGFYIEIPTDLYNNDKDVVKEITKLIHYKNKVNAYRRPPRIILLTPPCMNKNIIADKICKEFQMIHINIIDLLQKEIMKKNQNSKIILSSLEKNVLVADKLVINLLEERLFSSDCMVNGWILTGFPKSKIQINFIDNMPPEIKPSLIILIDMEKKNIEFNAKKLKYDPITGKYFIKKDNNKYESVDNPEKKVSNDIIKRLIKPKISEPKILSKRIEDFKVVFDILNKKKEKNIIKLKGDGNNEKIISQLIIDAILNSCKSK